MYLIFLGFFSVVIIQLYILNFFNNYIELDTNHKNYDLNLFIKNCTYLIVSFILIYITTHCYFRNINKLYENDYIVLFLCIIILFYWSYQNISWFKNLINLK